MWYDVRLLLTDFMLSTDLFLTLDTGVCFLLSECVLRGEAHVV